MEAPSTTRITFGFVAAFVLLAVNAAVSYVTLDKMVGANRLVAQTEQAIKLLGELRASLIDAEAGQRGFIITGEERYLEPYLSARAVIAAKLKELARLTAYDAEETARMAALEPLVGKKFDGLNAAIAARREQGAQAASVLVRDDQGKVLMERIQRILGDIQNKEEVVFASRSAESEFNAYITMVTYMVATFLNVCLFGGICFLVIRGAVTRKKSAAVERGFNEKVASSLAEVRELNQEITFLSRMSNFLQTCATSEEACTAIAHFGLQLFPTEVGVIYLFHASRNYVEQAALWGGANPPEDMFQPADCWALRRGRLHVAGEKDATMVCAHVARHAEPVQPYVCAPIIAQGETLGLLFLQSHSAAGGAVALSKAKQQLAAAVAEHFALALSNIKLRETLRQQSVRDPLTGLYNRRFLEETLDRELGRLERKKLPLSLFMIDVDNFKSFNDTFGHEAGDAVLRDLGGILQRHVRGGDTACRYGGEEFTIVLPETNIDIGRQRAEMLREAMCELHLMYDGKPLGAVTLSIGVACFPEHGRRREQLLQAADAALYEAKHGGRNRVVVSSIKTLKVIETLPQHDQAGR